MKFTIIKILIVIGIILFLIGAFGEYTLVRLSPRYDKLNKEAVKNTIKELNLNNNKDLFIACRLLIESNTFYDEYRSLSSNIRNLGMYCLAIAFFVICYFKFSIIGKILKLNK